MFGNDGSSGAREEAVHEKSDCASSECGVYGCLCIVKSIECVDDVFDKAKTKRRNDAEEYDV